MQSLAVVILLLVAQFAHAQRFVEGTHFLVLNNSVRSDSQEVVEYFSFSCPGCYAMEPLITSMQQAQPNINLRRVHMRFGGRNAKQSQHVFVLMELLNAEQHKDAIFKRIHVTRDLFDNVEEVIGFFVELGYERKMVAQMARSFSADTRVRQMNKDARNNKIASVPTIIVNGKYQVILNALTSASDFNQLIHYLDGLSE